MKLYVDHYVGEMLFKYKDYIKKWLLPKRVPISPKVILRLEECAEVPDPANQKYYLSFVAKLQFAASWIMAACAVLCVHRGGVLRYTPMVSSSPHDGEYEGVP
jgi:hypothetical protein